MFTPRPLLLSLALSLVVLGTACGVPDAPSAEEVPEQPDAALGSASPEEPLPASSATFPVTVSVGDDDVTLAERPERIVSLSPTATEMLFAIGADEQVVAVDTHSNFPPEAPTSDLSGFEPNVEAILGYEPDVVVASSDPGGLVSGLAAAQVPTIVHAAAGSLDDAYAQIEQLGAATGHVADAARLVARMRSEIGDIVAQAAGRGEGLSYYHELDTSLFSVSSDTFIGEVYGLLGLDNIADEAAERAGSPYPQLSAEYVVEADPDLILLADTKCCDVDAETVAARPGWGEVSAVKHDAIVELDDDVASRWGPRVVQLLRRVADEVAALQPQEG